MLSNFLISNLFLIFMVGFFFDTQKFQIMVSLDLLTFMYFSVYFSIESLHTLRSDT